MRAWQSHRVPHLERGTGDPGAAFDVGLISAVVVEQVESDELDPLILEVVAVRDGEDHRHAGEARHRRHRPLLRRRGEQRLDVDLRSEDVAFPG